MSKYRQLSQELLPLIDVILFSYIELIFRGGVSCLSAALLFSFAIYLIHFKFVGIKDMHNIRRAIVALWATCYILLYINHMDIIYIIK